MAHAPAPPCPPPVVTAFARDALVPGSSTPPLQVSTRLAITIAARRTHVEAYQGYHIDGEVRGPGVAVGPGDQWYQSS